MIMTIYSQLYDALIQHPSHLTLNTNQSNIGAETNEVEYGVVNQPMSDSFSPNTLGRMISQDKGNAGDRPMRDDGS